MEWIIEWIKQLILELILEIEIDKNDNFYYFIITIIDWILKK